MADITIPRGPAASLRRNPASPARHVDLVLLSTTLAVAALGVLMVFSATRSGLEAAGLDPFTYLKRQAMFVVLGAAVMVLTALVDYRSFRDLAGLGYAAAVLLLVLVLSPLGTEVNGSQSWFAFGAFQLQPAELAKLAVIVALAAYCAAHRGDLDIRRLGICILIAGLPAGLIFLQPDVGSMLVFVALTMGILLVAGARPRHIAGLAVVGVLGVVGVFQLGLVEDYQRERLTVFATSDRGGEVDRLGAAYNVDQAKTAIGAGGLFGAGLFDGTQTRGRFVPEQQTDFIFTVVGEELGFAGSASLLALYAVLAWRLWRAAQLARDFFGTLVCTGVLAMLVFQVFENMGMAMGIMPVTGLPLPFLSYGGSSTLMMFAAVGLVENIHMRRFS